jgi:hypothetical protein
MLIDFPKTQNLNNVLTFFLRTNETFSPSKLPLLLVQASLISHHRKSIKPITNKALQFVMRSKEQR